jgi:hypothetical protein
MIKTDNIPVHEIRFLDWLLLVLLCMHRITERYEW